MTCHWINGAWSRGEGREFQSLSPCDDSVLWSGREATATEVATAVQSARAAFPHWSLNPHRASILETFAAIVRRRDEELTQLISAETGKPGWEARTEVATVVGKAALALDAIHTRRDTTSFPLGDQSAVTRFKPHGALAVLGPYNFPAHLPNAHIMPALAAGNTVVFKPSEQTPAVGEWMAHRWQEAGLPDGVLNLVQGGRETGQTLAACGDLDGLLFTGSSRVGRALHRLYADWPQKILALEMGGNNPLIVCRAANTAAAACHTVLSAYLTAGQRCTCARRLIVVRDGNQEPFLKALLAAIRSLQVGFPADVPEPFMGTVISPQAGRSLLAAQEKLLHAGASALVTMQPLRGCDALLSPGLLDVTHAPTDDEEYFGPLLQLHWADSLDEAIDLANRTAYGLSAGLLSDDRASYERFITCIRAGVINWNRQTTGASGKLPFGGCGLSGNHRPSGYFAADYCSYPVAALESPTLDLPTQIPPGFPQ